MKKWMGRVFVFLGMALMAFPVLQLEYGKVRTGELLKVVENEMEVKKVSVGTENAGDDDGENEGENLVNETAEIIE